MLFEHYNCSANRRENYSLSFDKKCRFVSFTRNKLKYRTSGATINVKNFPVSYIDEIIINSHLFRRFNQLNNLKMYFVFLAWLIVDVSSDTLTNIIRAKRYIWADLDETSTINLFNQLHIIIWESGSESVIIWSTPTKNENFLFACI